MEHVKITLEIDYTTDGRLNQEGAESAAIDLAICPNMHTICEGVTLNQVRVTNQEGEIISTIKQD